MYKDNDVVRKTRSRDTGMPQIQKLSSFLLLRIVSRCGLAVRRKACKQKDLGSIPLRLSFILCGLWTLPCNFVPHN